MSIWDELAAKAPEESAGFEDLPIKAWVLTRTVTREDSENAVARIKVQETKNGDLHKFSVGLIAIGGDKNLVAKKHGGRYLFLEAFVHPGDKETGDNVVSNRLTGFLNALFANGVAVDEKDEQVKKQKRWQAVISVLRQVAETNKIDPSMYDGDMARFLAGLAAAALENDTRTILVKTTERKYEARDGSKKSSIDPGTFEDDTPANRTKRGVSVFNEDGSTVVAGPPAGVPSF